MLTNMSQKHPYTRIFQYLIAVAVLFLGLYSFNIKSIPISMGKIIAAIGLLCFVVLLFRKKLFQFLDIKNHKVFVLMGLGLAYSLILSAVIKRTNDFDVPYAYLLFFVEHCVTALFFVWLLKRFDMYSIEYFFKIYVLVCLSQAAIILFSYLSVDIRNVIINFTGYTERFADSDKYGQIRDLGLAAHVIFELAIIQSIALIFVAYLSSSERRLSRQIFYAVAYVLIAFSALLSGRTAYFGIALSVIIFLWCIFLSKQARKNALKTVSFIVLAVIIIVMLCGGIAFSHNDALISKVLVDTNIFLLEPLYNTVGTPKAYLQWLDRHHVDHGYCTITYYFFKNHNYTPIVPPKQKNGKPAPQSSPSTKPSSTALPSNKSNVNALTNSTEKLLEDIFNISRDKITFFGTGKYYGSNSEHISDSGYVRHLLYYGILGSILLYAFYVAIIWKTVRASQAAKNRLLSVLLVLVAIYLAVSHFKGDILLSSGMVVKTILLSYFVVYGSYQPILKLKKQIITQSNAPSQSKEEASADIA